MDPTTLVALIVALVLSLLCGGGGLLLLVLFVVGVVLLRRRGKKKVTAQDAVRVGAERVSQIFRRTKDGRMEPIRDEDEG